MIYLYLIIVILILIRFYQRICERPYNFPPGPKWIPIFGNLILLRKLSRLYGGQHLALRKLAEEYETNVLGLKLGGEYVITVFSHDVVKKVFNDELYDGRPDNYFIRLRSMGKRTGITFTDGELWRIQRSFVVTHLRNLGFGQRPMENFIKEEIREVLDILNSRGDDVRIPVILGPAIINILWALISGSSISRSDKRLDSLLKLLSERAKAFDLAGGILGVVPFMRFIAPKQSGYYLVQEVNKQLRGLLQEVIAQHLQDWSEDNSNDDLIYSFITEIKKNEGNATTFTDDQLIMVLLDLFIAGSETTSNTLDFIFQMMILYPDIQKKVQKCLDMEFTSANAIEYADRIRVPYVEAVVFEVERYCHVAPLSGPRRVLEDTTLEGYWIPKDTTVLLSVHSIHNDKEYWKDPEIFRPDRFLDSDGKLLKNDRLIPFALGKRNCLGQALAKNCIFVFFAEIMRKYEVCLSPGSRVPQGKPVPGLTMSTEDYRAKFVDRIF